MSRHVLRLLGLHFQEAQIHLNSVTPSLDLSTLGCFDSDSLETTLDSSLRQLFIICREPGGTSNSPLWISFLWFNSRPLVVVRKLHFSQLHVLHGFPFPWTSAMWIWRLALLLVWYSHSPHFIMSSSTSSFLLIAEPLFLDPRDIPFPFFLSLAWFVLKACPPFMWRSRVTLSSVIKLHSLQF